MSFVGYLTCDNRTLFSINISKFIYKSFIDEACTADDLATVTERAKACARKWGKLCEGHERRRTNIVGNSLPDKI